MKPECAAHLGKPQDDQPLHSISHVCGLSIIIVYLAASVNPAAFGAFADAPTVLAVASTAFAVSPAVSVAPAVNLVPCAAFAGASA